MAGELLLLEKVPSVDKLLFTTNSAGGQTSQFQLSSDGTFSGSSGSPATGNYSLNIYSPGASMVQLNYGSGPFTGAFGWLQLNYDSIATGSYKLSIFDGAANLLATERGNFGQQ